MFTHYNNKIRKSKSKPKKFSITKNNYKIKSDILALNEMKKIFQKINAYSNHKLIKQLNSEKPAFFLNNYNTQDINILSKVLQKYFHFQQMTIGAFETHLNQSQNRKHNYNNQSNISCQKKRISKSLGKPYKKINQKELENINIWQKVFSSLQKHLKQTKILLSLVLQNFKINQEISQHLSQGISENKSLEYLSINNCVMPVNLYEILLKGLLTNEIIHYLDLSNNKLSDKYISMISRIIQRQSLHLDQIFSSYQFRNELPDIINYKIGLVSINLHGNQLGYKSAESISNVLYNNNYIRYINLSQNFFDNSACKLFVYMMRTNNTLLTIDLRENIGYDEFINPRIVMKMSKNIKYLYSNYKNGQYTEKQFEYLKGFIDTSFFDIDIPQEIVEYYNINVHQSTDTNVSSKNNTNREHLTMNNENEKIINTKEQSKNINIGNINNEKGNKKNNDNIKNINKERNIKNKNNNKEIYAFKENKELIKENLQLKKEILELKAKNLKNIVPHEEEKNLENYYNRANEIIDKLNEVMAKLQQHNTGKNNNLKNINNYNIDILKQNLINISSKRENNKKNNIKDGMNNNICINTNSIINNRNYSSKNENCKSNNTNVNVSDLNNLIDEKNDNHKEIFNKKEEKEDNKLKVKELKNFKFEKTNDSYNYNGNSNINILCEEEKNFKYDDDLTEEDQIDLIKHREILMKFEEDDEPRGPQFNIDQYLAQIKQEVDDGDYEEFGQHRHNNNKLIKNL